MADKKKKNKGAGDASKKPAAAKQAEAEPQANEPEAEETSEARDTEDEVAHAPAKDAHAPKAAHAHGAAHAGEHAPNRKEYLIIFGLLALLTLLEVGVTKVPGISKTGMGLSLVGMALTKAALVGFFFMHLKHETKFLRWTVALPMLAPTLYAIVLMSEAAWRYR